jgi:hypothetical protein
MVTPWRRSLSDHSVLQRAAALAWHIVGDGGADLGSLPLASLPGRGGVVFCWMRLFEYVVLVVVLLASAHDVKLLFFLNDTAVLLPLISKK